MKTMKNFGSFLLESVEQLPDDIFSWIQTEFCSKDCKIKKVSQTKEKITIKVDYYSPIVTNGFSDRAKANIVITVSDYADDYDYDIKITGKYGKYGKSTSGSSKESWQNYKEISVTDTELTYLELKHIIKKNLKYIIK